MLSESSSTRENRQCRICFGDEDTPENPLISPCDCTGSVQYIHYDCLKQWLNSKLLARSSEFSCSYVLKNLHCEICKSQLDERFIYRGIEYSLLQFPNITGPFIVFEVLKKETSKIKSVHSLKLNYKPRISVGRGTQNDIRMSDISVSRMHAEFKLTKMGLFLEDKNSKFGTLVLVRKKFPILKDKNNIFL